MGDCRMEWCELEFLVSLWEARRAALAQAERHADGVMSGYTHLQPAQPATFGHCLLGVSERDTGRIAACHPVTNRCPLGAAAMAGTTSSPSSLIREVFRNP